MFFVGKFLRMGIVTEHLIQLIVHQVDVHGLVIWYDPEQAYADVAAELTLERTTVACWDGSFFQLRRNIDHLLNDGKPPRLVVYVPIDREFTNAALIELDVAGVVMQPRQRSPACNTRLSVVARNALSPILGEEQVAEIERQVDAGKLTLADLNSLADKGRDISTGVLSLIFGTANPQEVALAFLHDDRSDLEIHRKEATKELRKLLQFSFGIELLPSDSLVKWRETLARHVLLTDMAALIKIPRSSSLASLTVAQNAGAVDACVRLSRAWRNSREHRDSYVVAAGKTEKELPVLNEALGLLEESLNLGLGKREDVAEEPATADTNTRAVSPPCETLLAMELQVLQAVESELQRAPCSQLLKFAAERLSGFWSDVMPTIQARWALVLSAAEVLIEANRVGRQLRKPPTTVPALINAYAGEDQPWCLLDTHHRHMESRKYNFEFAADGSHQALEKLITRAEQRYTEVGSELSRHFVATYAKAKHPIKGVLRQRDFFATQVQPHLSKGKVAYVWVDALRYEMAMELSRLLSDDFELQIRPAIALTPTITEIGMAALLPSAEKSARVVAAGGGKLAVEIAGTVIRDRRDRVAFLKEHAGVSVFEAKLDDLLPKPTKKVKDGIQAAQLTLITSQEIDELGEADNVAQARLQIDGVLGQLRRGVRVLADHGIRTIVLVADHGHLFADEIGDDMKIESPGGKVEDLHRRVWVGLGGNSEPSYLRTSLSSLGVDSELDLATPWTFAVFRAKGGSRSWFHGGLSPQELIVPVVVMHSTTKSQANVSALQWTMTPGTPKITTRFFSVQISGCQAASTLFGFEPPTVRLEVRANRKCVATSVSASYGFEDATGEVKLRVSPTDNKRVESNTITVMLSEEIAQKTVSVYLLDAVTGAELAGPLAIDVMISM